MKLKEEDYIVGEMFKKSFKKKGFLYVCEHTYQLKNIRTSEVEKCKQWKYGRTTDINRRMKMYGESYQLINKWDINNHLNLREYFISLDWNIEDDRRYKDKRTEHVDFDPTSIVDNIANCDLSLEYQGNNLRISARTDGEEFMSIGAYNIFNIVRI